MNPTLQQILDHLGDLPPMPHIAAQVLHRIEQPEVTARDLQAVLETDQAVAARVLRVANSALYGLPSRVKTLRQAVVVLGLYNLRSVVLAACMKQLFEATGPARKLFWNLWQHSLLTATAARLLAGWRAPRQAEEAFVGGLLHDIGKVALVRGDAKEYVSVVEHARESGVALHRAEEAVWGFDHATVGGLMLEQWRLPLEHQEAVRYHHQPEAAQVEPVLTALVSLSNEISHQVANDAEPDAAVLATCPAAKALRLTVTFLDDFLADVKARIARDSSQREDL